MTTTRSTRSTRSGSDWIVSSTQPHTSGTRRAVASVGVETQERSASPWPHRPPGLARLLGIPHEIESVVHSATDEADRIRTS